MNVVTEAPKPIGHVVRQTIVRGLTQIFGGVKAAFVISWEKIPVTEIERLRRSLSTVKADLTVVKNSLGQRALSQVGFSALESLLAGTSAIGTTNSDPVAVSKVLVTFAKDHEGFKLRGAVIEGQVVPVAAVKALAALPPRAILLAKVVGGLQAPISGFVRVLHGVVQKFVLVVDAIRQSKSNQEGQSS